MVQNVVVAKPYKFVAPFDSTRWPRLMRWILPRYLRKTAGVVRVEARGLDRLRASRDAGCGIMIAPNHCRPCDPFVVTSSLHQAGLYPHIMASSQPPPRA